MRFIMTENYEELSRRAAEIIADTVRANPACVLGLATGSTPIGAYRELARMHREAGLDFSRARSFNLDEYYPMSPTHPQSYRYFMEKNLFSQINLPSEKTAVPRGDTENPPQTCRAYEEAIAEAGGIDLQLLGIGQNGHIGFNEPGDTLYASTHLTPLTEDTIRANARFFGDLSEVPTHAISMGMGTILRARKILLLISGKNKHEALKKLYDDFVDPHCPATFLKLHPDVTVICDREAYHG